MDPPALIQPDAEVSEALRKYSAMELDAALRQGEILSDVKQHLGDLSRDPPEIVTLSHRFCVVVTQDCDLGQDFRQRASCETGNQFIDTILLLRALTPEELTNGGLDGGTRKNIGLHKLARFQLLQLGAADSDVEGVGVPELVVDFKYLFTVQRNELYRQLDDSNDGAKRRTRLMQPYREHLQQKLTS